MPIRRKAVAWGAGILVTGLAGWLLVTLQDPGSRSQLPERVELAETRSGGSNKFVLIEGGRFLMGSPDGVGQDTERPQHWVELSPFYIQQYEVTNEEYRLFDPDHDFPVGKERHPVVSVNWFEARDYAAWLGGTLPTEAQWEFTARGEEGRDYPWGAEPPKLGIHGNFGGMDGETKPVGDHPDGATPLGVHDMAGNVWEWCSDWYGPYPANAEKDPVGPDTGPRQVVRGGAFGVNEWNVRAASRNGPYPDFRFDSFGFRVVVSSFSP